MFRVVFQERMLRVTTSHPLGYNITVPCPLMPVKTVVPFLRGACVVECLDIQSHRPKTVYSNVCFHLSRGRVYQTTFYLPQRHLDIFCKWKLTPLYFPHGHNLTFQNLFLPLQAKSQNLYSGCF